MAVTKSGKDKLIKYTEVYLGPYALCEAALSYGGLMASYEPVDMAGWCQDKFYLHDVLNLSVDGLQMILDDTADNSLDRLKTAGTSYPVAFLSGGGGVPAVGDPAFIIPGINPGAIAGINSGKAIIQANFKWTATDYTPNIKTGFGVVLEPATALTGTETATGVDFEIAGVNGGWAVLLVTASDGGTWAFKIQDSANDSDWADLITFTDDGDAIISEVGSVAGAVDRYVRAVLTRTSGTVTASILFCMNP